MPCSKPPTRLGILRNGARVWYPRFPRFFIRVGRKTGVGLGAPPGKHGDVLQVLPSILTAWWFKSTSFILRCFNPSFTQHCWKEPINMRLWQHKHIRFDVFIPLVDRICPDVKMILPFFGSTAGPLPPSFLLFQGRPQQGCKNLFNPWEVMILWMEEIPHQLPSGYD